MTHSMIRTFNDRFIQGLGSLTRADLTIVSKLANTDRFTIPDVIAVTGFTDRGIRGCLRRLKDHGYVVELGQGGPGVLKSYRISLPEEAPAMAS